MSYPPGHPPPPTSAASAASTRTTTTVVETHVQTNLRWDPTYFRTVPGALKAVVLLCNLLGFICILFTGSYWRSKSVGSWYCLVSMTGFWTTGTLLLFYLLHVIEKFHVIPWLLIELVYCAFWAFFIFTAALDSALHADSVTAFGVAAFFGFLSAVLYGYDAYLKWVGWRAGQLAQGERTVQRASNNQVPPPPPPAAAGY